MRQRLAGLLVVFVWVCPRADPACAEPLDLADTQPRTIVAEFLFGGPQTAAYSVDGGVGEVQLSAESHQAIRPSSLEPQPELFTPLEIGIDLSTGHATSSGAAGAYQTGNLSESFSQGNLSTSAVAGFMSGNGLPPLFCSSQAEIDALCLSIPLFCGVVCNPVVGTAYAPATGGLLLVGSEQRVGCDGAVCTGPLAFFSSLEPVLSELVPTLVGDPFDWEVSRGLPPPLDAGSAIVIDPGLEDEVLGAELLGSFDFGPDTLRLTVVLEDGSALTSDIHWLFTGLQPVGAPQGVQITGLTFTGGTGTVVQADSGDDWIEVVTAAELAPPNVFTYDFDIEIGFLPEPDGLLPGVAALLVLVRRRRTTPQRAV